MKLNYTDGCICTSLTVDEIETIDLDINTFKNVIKKILTFGRDKNFTLLIECIHCLIQESYYSELAEKAGLGSAVRAVAGIVARNPFIIIVPVSYTHLTLPTN